MKNTEIANGGAASTSSAVRKYPRKEQTWPGLARCKIDWDCLVYDIIIALGQWAQQSKDLVASLDQ